MILGQQPRPPFPLGEPTVGRLGVLWQIGLSQADLGHRAGPNTSGHQQLGARSVTSPLLSSHSFVPASPLCRPPEAHYGLDRVVLQIHMWNPTPQDLTM